MGLKIALALGLVLAWGGFGVSPGMGAEIPYKTYSNVTMNTGGDWTQTGIHVPRGAMVAVMAEGDCWSVRAAAKKRLDPTASVRFKIGEKAAGIRLTRLYDSRHVAVVKSPSEPSSPIPTAARVGREGVLRGSTWSMRLPFRDDSSVNV